ncbi:Type 1 glutamine amidotransferase (GATase1) [Blastococcus sp. DSM 46786]|uniref:LamG-like jellyroll fold domain-containing protein n=1 Tax=Blastococcus sp. DSM 46786 TaxID=1798227 RepID=UPI0008C7202E|nr:LamG-like jellyroll fold domain-containing protein [Blastococcus sp. DSM 46786]SEM07903.1 Type 1 glutamine amidotransferase (GATase1) [Blastococcus sp. DSM 46786]
MLGIASAAKAVAAPVDGVLKIVLFYKPNFHASHVQAREAVRQLAAEVGASSGQTVEIQETDDAGAFTDANLADKDAVVFAQTGGILFDDAQRAALETFIRGGGGYMGLHYAGWSVGQTEHDVNPFYARLVGAVSEGHPENPAVRPGRVVVKDPTHPLTQSLPSEFTRSDEWYDWVVNPAPNVRTLLEADEASYATDASGGRQGTSHPITWCQEIDAGRSWYTAMGHEGTAYAEPVMLQQMRHGLAYAAGVVAADCSPPVKEEVGAWSGVTPWPLVPINVALTSDGRVQSFGSVSTGCTDGNPYDWTGNSCVAQGGQFEIDVWDPATPRTLANLRDGVIPNTTYTDLFCAMQVQDPHRHSTMTVGGDDTLGDFNDPVNGAVGVTSYSTNNGLQTEAPMNYPRWYPTGTTMPNGDIVVQGGSVRGVAGPGVHTPEIRTADEGSGWRPLTGATSSVAYGDGGADHAGQDENRWWYPRAFVAPGNGNLFNISGTQMFELDPSSDGTLTLRGTLPASVASQGDLGNPVGATSTATMYRPGKILQVGGGWWANGGGPDGARAGFTVDIAGAGGTAAPVIAPTEPMRYQRHWATSTVLPDGDVLVTGGGRENNGRDDVVTNPEIWDPETGKWTTVDVPHEHARLYHSTALLLPDGRVMLGGGGTPGPRNYTDVEYYSPAYLFDGDAPAVRPEILEAPESIGYDGTFDITTSGDVSRVTLVRNGSVTHGFNNDQNFQDLEFTQGGSGAVTITAPQDGTYAPPGAYMLFVFDADGTPSVASIVTIDPTVPMDTRTPQVVDQFEYPRVPAEWRSATPPTVVDVAPGAGRLSPWEIVAPVQLVRATAPSNGGLGHVGYHLALGPDGTIERRISGLDVGREYRLSLRYARDSRSAAGDGDATARVAVGSLDATVTATAAGNPSQSGREVTFGTYVGTFTATARSEMLTLAGPGSGAGMVVDDLVIISAEPGTGDVPVQYSFEEGAGTTAANTGGDASVGSAILTGDTAWSEEGVYGTALDLPGGDRANAVDLPDDLLRGAADFSTSFWVRPDEPRTNWTGLFHIGNGTDGFFQIQTGTQADGPTGLAATFKAPGADLQERVYASPATDLVLGQWNHVAFTRSGSTGTLYLNGVEIAGRDDLTIDMADIGATADNWLGRNGFPDAALDGLMDEVRLYRSALSATDVAALHAEGSALRTTTAVSVAPASPSPFGEPLTVSAEVQGQDGQPAEGRAELWIDGVRNGGAVALSAGTVSFPEVALSPGDHGIEVRYLAAEGWRDSTGSVTHAVERPPVGEGVPVHYTFDEGAGTEAGNSGTDPSIGPAVLSGDTSWTPDGQFGTAVSLPGGDSATPHFVDLPDNISAGMDTEFTMSLWIRPDALPNWVPHVQIGSSTDKFFLLQSSTQANGATGFAATFKKAGVPAQERLVLGAGNDLPLNEWTHVVFTQRGSTGKIYFDGELQATRTDFTIDIGDIGAGGTTANFIGNTSWGDPHLDGVVDDFRMYGYELTAEQVQELFQPPDTPNTAPVGVSDAYTTEEGVALTVPAPGVLANDTDADGDALTAIDVTQPVNGTVTVEADGSFAYTPDAGFSGKDLFTYAASDGQAGSAPVRVSLSVERAAPPAVTQTVATAETFTYGQPGTVVATVNPGTAEGVIAVREGTTVIGTATLSAGQATVTLPAKSLPPGSHLLSVRYVGDEDHAPSVTYLSVEVEKVTPTMTVGAPVKNKKNTTVTVSLTAPDDIPVTGEVDVTATGGTTVTGTLKDGSVVVTLPKRTKNSGTMTVVYRGSDLAASVRQTVSYKVG